MRSTLRGLVTLPLAAFAVTLGTAALAAPPVAAPPASAPPAASTPSAAPTARQCIEANDKGQVLQHAGKLGAAEVEFGVCVVSSCPGPVRKDCSDAIQQIDATMPSLVFGAQDSAQRDITAVHVTLDGVPVTATLGTAVLVDPGPHHVELEATGLVTTKMDIVVLEREKGRRVLGVMAAPEVATVSVKPAPSSARRTWGIVATTAGAAGVVAGSVVGLVAVSSWHSANDACESHGCTPTEASRGSSALGLASASTVVFVASAVVLAGGIVVWATAPSKDHAQGATAWRGVEVRAAATPSAGSVTLGGAW